MRPSQVTIVLPRARASAPASPAAAPRSRVSAGVPSCASGVFAVVLVLGAGPAAAVTDPVSAGLRVASGVAAVEMTIAPGWHVNANDPTDKFLIPTTLQVTPPPGMRAGAVRYPAAVEKALEFAEGKKLRLFEGRVRIEAPLEGTPSEPGTVRAKLRYQACDHTTCLP